MRISTTPAVPPRSSFMLLSRLYTSTGTVAVPANFAALTLTVYDTEDMVNPLASAVSLSPISSYIYSTLQTDRDWAINFDSTGYNFAYLIPAAYLPHGGKLYQFQFTADAGGGYKTEFAFNVPTLALTGA